MWRIKQIAMGNSQRKGNLLLDRVKRGAAMNHTDSTFIGSITLQICPIAEQRNMKANVMNECVEQLLKEPPDPRTSNHSSIDDYMLRSLPTGFAGDYGVAAL